MMMENPEMQAPYPVIVELECKACGRCALACPKKLLKPSGKLNARGYEYMTYVGEGCVGCGSCYYTCPEPNCLSVVRS